VVWAWAGPAKKIKSRKQVGRRKQPDKPLPRPAPSRFFFGFWSHFFVVFVAVPRQGFVNSGGCGKSSVIFLVAFFYLPLLRNTPKIKKNEQKKRGRKKTKENKITFFVMDPDGLF
jgi:hypothetical protein